MGTRRSYILEYEIMSRLPVKSLMRFKCVCKRWQYLIEKDPVLIQSHLNQSLKKRQGLFIISKHPTYKHPAVKPSPNVELECYWTADLFVDGVAATTTTIQNIPMRDPLVFDEILKPVNGLMCFINRDMFAVCVYNVSTRQSGTPRWIKSTLLDTLKEDYGVELVREHREYQFGFDPTTKEHKVICVWDIRTRKRGASVDNDYIICEVLTLGNNNSTWRKIDEVPPFDIMHHKSVHVNGSIYWTGCYDDQKDEVLVSFKVGSEKFGVIKIPYYVTNYRLSEVFYQDGPCLSCNVHILEVDGCVAFARRTGIRTVQLWVFEDEYDKKKGNETIEDWRAEIITLPLHWTYKNIWFHAVVGTDKLVLQCYNLPTKPQSVYLYSRKEKTFSGIHNSSEVLSSSSSSAPDILYPYVFTTFVESLLHG